MTKIRKVYVTGEINHDSYAAFADELSDLEAESRTKVIHVEICSGGGIANAAYAYVARMRMSPCKIVTIGMGEVASAATLILAAGDRRLLARESVLMVHEDTGDYGELTSSQVAKEAKDAIFLETHWNTQFGAFTKTEPDYWATLNKRTVWMDAARALELNIVDELI